MDGGGERRHVITSGRVLPNRKRQLAAQATDAEILAFIDDDAYPDPEWLANAVRHFADPTVAAVGGPALTPPGDTPAQRAGGAVFSSILVTATTRHRYVAESARDVESLPSCNLLVRREAFLRDAHASVRYWPGEDILLCMFAARDGARIVYDPDVLVYHHRRPLFGPHLRQVWAYGRFRGHFYRRLRSSDDGGIYAVPALFVLAHAPVAAAAMRRPARVPALLAVLAYATVVLLDAGREARAARANPWITAAGIYLTHVCYGAATIAGWFCGPRVHR